MISKFSSLWEFDIENDWEWIWELEYTARCKKIHLNNCPCLFACWAIQIEEGVGEKYRYIDYSCRIVSVSTHKRGNSNVEAATAQPLLQLYRNSSLEQWISNCDSALKALSRKATVELPSEFLPTLSYYLTVILSEIKKTKYVEFISSRMLKDMQSFKKLEKYWISAVTMNLVFLTNRFLNIKCTFCVRRSRSILLIFLMLQAPNRIKKQSNEMCK